MGCRKLTYYEQETERNEFRKYSYAKELTPINTTQKARREQLDEIYGSGNSYTAPFWQYDSRLGRRWNIDPVVKDWESSYATFNNNPILKIDPLGNNATKYEDEEGNLLLDTEDGSEDVVTVPDDKVEDFEFYKESYENEGMKPVYDSKGWNDNMKADILGYETINEMEGELGNTSSQWSRQQLIDYKQKPTMANWAKWLAAEVLGQNANPLNHLPVPIKIKGSPKLKIESNVKAPSSKQSPSGQFKDANGKFTKEDHGNTEAAQQEE